MNSDEPVKVKDLESPIFMTFFRNLVVNVIRRCFLIYSPLLITIILGFSSLIYWGFDQLMQQHKQTAGRQLEIIQQNHAQDIKINILESEFNDMRNDIQRIEHNNYGP